MRLFAPAYYQKFKCIADRCTHSCCVGWEIDIDEETYQRYQQLDHPEGARIRAGIAVGVDGPCFALDEKERCPNLDARGLCRIISNLGESYLCEICREHPRFYNVLEDRTECGVGAACEAAAALILSEDGTELVQLEGEPCHEKRNTCGDFDAISQRNALFSLLSDRSLPLARRIKAIREELQLAPITDAARRASLASLEYLNEEHRALFVNAALAADDASLDLPHERFLTYLIYRHASAAEDLLSFRAAVGMALLLSELFVALCQKGIAPITAAVTVSEEIEYSTENTAALQAAISLTK